MEEMPELKWIIIQLGQRQFPFRPGDGPLPHRQMMEDMFVSQHAMKGEAV
jgi:hypothetical protein